MRLIMLWGDFDDSPLAAVFDALQARGHKDFLIIDQNKLDGTEFEFSVSDRVAGQIKSGGETYDLADVASVYLRPYSWDQANDETGVYRQQLNEALTCWCEISPALVVNRVSSMASNASKPYQACIINEHGFKTPDTLITTIPQAVEEFCELHGDVIYKSISGVRSIVARLSKEKMKNIQDIVWSPTQFQQQVPGKDIRVHVIGGQVVCSEIFTDADDYRYAGRNGHDLEIRPCEIPDDCRKKCIDLVESMGLAVGGVDLRLTADGDWYCFEVNPSPGFTYYQDHTGQDIAGHIADLLIAACRDETAIENAGLDIGGKTTPAAVSFLPNPHDDISGSGGVRTECERQRLNPAQVKLTG